MITDHFDDGGYTGANMDRPALKRLLAAVEARSVDCIVVYQVDRLSRSLLDFARIIEVFDRNRHRAWKVVLTAQTAPPDQPSAATPWRRQHARSNRPHARPEGLRFSRRPHHFSPNKPATARPQVDGSGVVVMLT